MMHWQLYLDGLVAMLLFAALGWLISLYRNNVTHVDSMWSLFFLVAAGAYVCGLESMNMRGSLMMGLLTIWALRLFVYLTWRNWGPHEDHRYVEIRNNNQPNFKFKSIYIIFGLQAVLAWIISLPILGALSSETMLNVWDALAVLLVLFGLTWETLADWQLARFKQNPTNKGKVLNQGVWRYSRHPNYFGESCVWWGFFLLALAGGAWWALPSAILMTLLLLKVSGVSLLEKDIAQRRPEYAQYMQTTNAFIPGKPKANKS
jgi:steroid 5-alpha reductase family enzyme